jgi:type I restriction enzyme S subunit
MAAWQTKPLSEVTQFINGLWKGEEPPFIHVGVIRNTNFTKDGTLDATDIAYLEVEVKKFQKRKLQVGDLILEKSGGGPRQPVGRVVLFDKEEGDFSFSNFTAAIRIIDPTSLDARYLHKYLHWVYVSGRTEAMQSHSTGIRNLNGDAYKAIEVAYPSIPEQRSIVATLDEAFEGIATAKANAEKNLQNARDLVGTGYQTIVGSFDQSQWGKAPVADLAAASKGSMRTGPFGSQLLHSEFVDDGIAVLGIDNAVANEFRWDKRRYITEAKYQDLARYRVHPGDVLITIMGTCGRCAVVPDDIPLAINTKHLCCITLDRKKCLPDYLHLYFLHDPLARDYLAAQAKGSIMAGLNMGIISALPVRLPPLDQQATIVERFSSLQAECDRLADVQMRKLAALDELRRSLLHQAFTGGLSSQNDRSTDGRGLQMCTR